MAINSKSSYGNLKKERFKMSKKELWENITDTFEILRCDILCLMDKHGWGWLLLILCFRKIIMEFTLISSRWK
jgi:hypothetical protein